jgi:hypothetical protein
MSSELRHYSPNLTSSRLARLGEMLLRLTIGPPNRPHEVSYMSLSEAAYWIATEGGSRGSDIIDAAVWQSAFDQLLKRIVNGGVAVVGRQFGDGLHENVPGYHFLGIQISYPYYGHQFDRVSSDDPYLRCGGIFHEDHRRNWLDDRLLLRRLEIGWSDLRCKGADIARHWPFAKASQGRRGRRPKYDRSDVRHHVFQLMNERGEFCDVNIDTDGWSQADLERAVMSYLNDEPADSTVRSYVVAFAAEWRAQNREADN